MVENYNHCVLQWTGHAGYVTERFSGLLARQALVDVTLICEEQKLRVHKLVLASNSVYFEEILQQDLGQEPVIFLKDLNFEILKAMVEFMYCGETIVSQQNLPSLLAASKVFKVRELVCIINTIMENESPAVSSKDKFIDKETQENYTSTTTNDFLNESNTSLPDSSDNVIFVETNSLKDKQLEHSLYEDSYENENNTITSSLALNVDEKEQNHLYAAIAQERLQNDIKSNNLQLNECCNGLDLDVSDRCTPSTKEILSESSKKSMEDTMQFSDKLEKYVKVYTHKKRKTINDIKSKLNRLNELIPISSSNNCIDLSDEPSNHVPVTLLTSLDMECAEYILSLDNENMRSVAEGLINEQLSLIKQKELNLIPSDGKKHNDDELDVEKKPVLRRSVRLNQQENEELINANGLFTQTTITEKQLEKSHCPSNKTDSIKGKRKIKESSRKVSDQNALNAMKLNNKRCFSNLHAHKNNTSKLIVKKNIKSVCKEKDDQKPRTTNKLKCKMNENANAFKISVPSPPSISSSIGYISRALWGDMSDIIEHNDDIMELTDYTPDGEIPFAVGLLPLRTALEKMQATPDYQPRKTRSSVAPVKQETNNLKRKHLSEPSVFAKKQNSNNVDHNDKTNAVCHIQIRAAPSQYIKSRKKFLPEHVSTLRSAAVVNKR